MYRGALALIASALVLVASVSRADEAYILKVARDEKGGEKYHITMTEKGNNNVVLTDAGGAVLSKQKESTDKTTVLEKTIVAIKPGKSHPDKAVFKFEKVNHVIDGAATDFGLTGRTVMAEMKGNKYECRIDGGGELTEQALSYVRNDLLHEGGEEHDFEQLILSSKPVRVGETWTCKVDEIARDIEKGMGGMKLEVAKAKGTGKLLK